MAKDWEQFKDIKSFGKSLGLSEIEMELIFQKKKLIEKLKRARIKRGLTQAQLAEMVQSKQPAIARMESGLTSEVSMDFLCKVAFVLGVSVTIKGNVA
jgi:DNA-binding XRE family transcriptional regulator